MQPVESGEALGAGKRLTLFSAISPTAFQGHQVWMDETTGIALALKIGVSCYQVENEEGRIHLLLHLPMEGQNETRWCLWRPDQASFDSRSIFEGTLVEEQRKPE